MLDKSVKSVLCPPSPNVSVASSNQFYLSTSHVPHALTPRRAAEAAGAALGRRKTSPQLSPLDNLYGPAGADLDTTTEATAPAMPGASNTISHQHFLCRCGDFSHWNVRQDASTNAEVVAVCVEGDILEFELQQQISVAEEEGWLCLADGTGWVRQEQGGWGWTPVHLEVREEARSITTWRALEFAEATGKGSLLLRRTEEPGRFVLWTKEGEVEVGNLQFDGRRTLCIPGHIAVLLPWEGVATLLAALSFVTGIRPSYTAPTEISTDLLPYAPDEVVCDAQPNTLLVPECRFRPPNAFVLDPQQWTLSAAATVKSPSGAHRAKLQGPGPRHPIHSKSQPVFTPRQESYRQRLMNMYQFYRPEKLPSVMPTVHASAGREEQVLSTLVEKYGPEPRNCMHAHTFFFTLIHNLFLF